MQAQLMKALMLGGEQKKAQGPQEAITLRTHRDSDKVTEIVQHPTCDHLQKSPCQKGRDRSSIFKQHFFASKAEKRREQFFLQGTIGMSFTKQGTTTGLCQGVVSF